MVYRIYVEKKKDFAGEAQALSSELCALFGLPIEDLRIINRYDVEGIDEELFRSVVSTVFSEPQVDDTFEELVIPDNTSVFAVEYLPGQFDQRANSASECIQLISKGERPEVRSAKVYLLKGIRWKPERRLWTPSIR